MEKIDGMSEVKSLSFVPQAVVLGNGSFPVAKLPLLFLGTASYLLCCDGAVNKLVEHGMKPDFIIGDGDSISEENRQRYADRFMQVAEQESNDQTKAVNFLRGKGLTDIVIVGATGGREDHTLGNISLLVDYRRMGLNVRMYTDTGFFVAARGDTIFESRPGQQVSVFSMAASNMASVGLKYPLHKLSNWWQGTLNEALAEGFTVRTSGDFIVFMEY
jgi:thiamine pyrophosphokinase